MRVGRLDLKRDATHLEEAVQQMQENFLQSLPHQHALIENLENAQELGRQTLFNTIMSVQYVGSAQPQRGPASSGVSFKPRGGRTLARLIGDSKYPRPSLLEILPQHCV